jgi:hypothetical protein
MFAIGDPIGYDVGREPHPMSECKHGLKHGCAYCHVTTTPAVSRPAPPKKKTRGSSLSDKMNDRMTALKKRLREIRGE